MFTKKRKAVQRINEIFEEYTPEQVVRDHSLLTKVQDYTSKYNPLYGHMTFTAFQGIEQMGYLKKIQKPIFEIADRVRGDYIDILRWVGDDGFGRDVEGFRLVDVEFDVELVLYQLDTPWGPSYRFKSIKGNSAESEFLWKICKIKEEKVREKPLVGKREELAKIYCGE